MVHEREGEDLAAFRIDRDEAAVADARREIQQPGLELLAAGPLRGDGFGPARIRAGMAAGHWLVRHRPSVRDALAVIGERVIALAVIARKAGEVTVSRPQQGRPRHPPGDRNRNGRHGSQPLETACRCFVTLDEGFRRGQPAVPYRQPQGHHRRHAVLPDRHERRDMTCRNVRHHAPVAAAPVDAAPLAVAGVQLLAVLGEAESGRDRQPVGIVRDHGVEPAVDLALQAVAVAGDGRRGWRGRDHGRRIGAAGGERREQGEAGQAPAGIHAERRLAHRSSSAGSGGTSCPAT